jgi:hypothetical protein
MDVQFIRNIQLKRFRVDNFYNCVIIKKHQKYFSKKSKTSIKLRIKQ